jgi:hypothetical protein
MMKKGFLQISKMAAAIIGVAVFSCTRKSDIKLPDHIPTLVLHGYVNVGDTFGIYLGKTFKADKWESIDSSFVTDGWMLLYEGNELKDSLHYDPNTRQYMSSYMLAKPGKTYRIVAGAKNFTTVEATATAPEPVNTVSIHRVKNARTDANGISLDDVTYVFKDPSGQRNFYLATLTASRPGSTIICVYTYDPSIEKYTEGFVPFDQSSCIGNSEILFTDKSFNGRQKELTISTETGHLEKYLDPFSGRVYKPYFKKFNIIEEHYKYFKNANTLYLNSGVPTLTDPIIIKGNVKNGYGLFTLFTSTVDSLP